VKQGLQLPDDDSEATYEEATPQQIFWKQQLQATSDYTHWASGLQVEFVTTYHLQISMCALDPWMN